jgi:hypothetical protein
MPEPAANPGRLRVDPARGGGDGGDTQVQSSTIGGQCEIGNPNPQEMGGAAAGRGRKDGTYRGSDAGRETLRGGTESGTVNPEPRAPPARFGKGGGGDFGSEMEPVGDLVVGRGREARGRRWWGRRKGIGRARPPAAADGESGT